MRNPSQTYLTQAISDIWLFTQGLGKTIYHWDKLPKDIKPLAGTDTSGIVQYKGRKYYVRYEWQISATTIEVM